MTKKQIFKLAATLAIVPGGFIVAIVAAVLIVAFCAVVVYSALFYLAGRWCFDRLREEFCELLNNSGRKREGQETSAASGPAAQGGPGLSEKVPLSADNSITTPNGTALDYETRWLQ